ncbi:MAG: hypothetical protein ABSG25_04415 [Bryobacteraceae bacterium]
MSFMRSRRNIFATQALLVTASLFAQQVPAQQAVQATAQPTPPAAAPGQAQSKTVLFEGTPMRMRLTRSVSSADANVGDAVGFETLDDIQIGGVTVIPKGSPALATVINVVPKRRLGRGGKLDMRADYVRLPSGEKLPLSGSKVTAGHNHQGAMAGAMVATSIVVWPAAPFFLFMHGKDITIPEGQELTVYTASDYDTAKGLAPAAAMAQ